MVENLSHRLPKQERVCSKKLIDRLFNGGHSHTMSAFPLRVVYMTMTQDEGDASLPPTQLLVSVPKRHIACNAKSFHSKSKTSRVSSWRLYGLMTSFGLPKRSSKRLET